MQAAGCICQSSTDRVGCMQPKADYAVSQDTGVLYIVSSGLAICAIARGRLSALQQYVS